VAGSSEVPEGCGGVSAEAPGPSSCASAEEGDASDPAEAVDSASSIGRGALAICCESGPETSGPKGSVRWAPFTRITNISSTAMTATIATFSRVDPRLVIVGTSLARPADVPDYLFNGGHLGANDDLAVDGKGRGH